MRILICVIVTLILVGTFPNLAHDDPLSEIEVCSFGEQNGMAIVGTRVDNEDPVLDSDDSPDDGTTGDLYGFDLAVYDNIAVDRV